MPVRRVRRPGPRGVRGAVLCALLALTACTTGAVTVDAPTPQGPAAETCRGFLDALPEVLDDLGQREVEPGGAAARAWGEPAVVVTCGGQMPPEFDRFSACDEVDGVGWFAPDVALEDPAADVELTTIGVRPVVAVRVPGEHRPPAGILVEVSRVVKRQLEIVRRCR